MGRLTNLPVTLHWQHTMVILLHVFLGLLPWAFNYGATITNLWHWYYQTLFVSYH